MCKHKPRSSASGSEMEESQSEGESSTDGERGPHLADLSAVKLQCLHSMGGPKDQSSYAVNGMSVKRIKQVLRNPTCECESCRSLTFKQLKAACDTFWCLPKSGQDAVLWSLQTSSSRSSWSIEGNV